MSEVANERELVEAAAAGLRTAVGAARWQQVRLGLVLGSGLREFATLLQDRVEVPFAQVSHWPVPKVEGHGGSLVLGRVGLLQVACLTGRVHLYEGFQPREVVRAVRTLRHLGVGTFLLTNAAGGIGDSLSPGDLMVVRDHLNLTGGSPLRGAHEPLFGPRFPDQSRVYAPELQPLFGPRLARGVYAGLQGPSYETPAEVEMLRRLGADAVGMSTVHEAIALNAMGASVAALSLISNLAAGIGEHPLSHDEVIAAGRQATALLTETVTAFCQRLAAR